MTVRNAKRPARRGGPARRERQGLHPTKPGTEAPLSPSRPFILRPVATSLLMAAILLAGIVAFTAASRFGAAGSRLPDDSDRHVLSRRKSRRHGLRRHRAARTAVRTGARLEPDDLDELRRQLGHRPAVFAQSEHRRRRAGGAGSPSTPRRPICRPICPTPPIYSKTNPADAPILTLALTSDTIPLSQVEDLADTRLAQKISQLPGVGLVSISGGQKPAVRIQVNPDGALHPTASISRTSARRSSRPASTLAKGNFDGPRQDYQIDANDQLLTSKDFQARRHRLSQRRARAALRRCECDRRCREREAGRLDE